MLGWTLRMVVGVALLGSAWVHFALWTDGYPGVIGPLFLLDAAGGLVLAVAVLAWRHWLPALGAFGFGVLTLGAYVLAATVGFLGLHDQFTTQAEYWGVVTEAVCVAGGAALMALRAREAR
ncbi:hypothetical protein [Amycolatopsis samaneae]|uniref:Uncharacterized protein n=1 Tax=Amycolatopsis samaneae TaxID=664691 RepID=A0ABW5GUR1_9PSEU